MKLAASDLANNVEAGVDRPAITTGSLPNSSVAPLRLRPRLPPGRGRRKAVAYSLEIRRLRAAGYSFASIRETLLEAGVSVSVATVKREAARPLTNNEVSWADAVEREQREAPPTPDAADEVDRTSALVAAFFEASSHSVADAPRARCRTVPPRSRAAPSAQVRGEPGSSVAGAIVADPKDSGSGNWSRLLPRIVRAVMRRLFHGPRAPRTP